MRLKIEHVGTRSRRRPFPEVASWTGLCRQSAFPLPPGGLSMWKTPGKSQCYVFIDQLSIQAKFAKWNAEFRYPFGLVDRSTVLPVPVPFNFIVFPVSNGSLWITDQLQRNISVDP